jgi:hypothetical protein
MVANIYVCLNVAERQSFSEKLAEKALIDLTKISNRYKKNDRENTALPSLDENRDNDLK